MIEQIPDEIMPLAEEALKYTGSDLAMRIRHVRQMIRQRTRRLNREARAAAQQLQSELRSDSGEREIGTQTN